MLSVLNTTLDKSDIVLSYLTFPIDSGREEGKRWLNGPIWCVQGGAAFFGYSREQVWISDGRENVQSDL